MTKSLTTFDVASLRLVCFIEHKNIVALLISLYGRIRYKDHLAEVTVLNLYLGVQTRY